MNTYPIKFEPILQEKIWGGSKLNTVLHKNCANDLVGESWEISGVQENISQVNNGEYKGLSIVDLLETHKEDFLGNKNYARFGNEFPLLIKFLDAKTNLSVQVHPDDTLAKEAHNSFGKTEMWYIMDHDEDAEIILGFKDETTESSVLENVNSSNVYDIFNTEKVTKGDAYYIPAGQIHAIGAGVLAAEIQQTSDITYRVYDWDRTDDAGNKRDLHIEESISASKKTLSDCKKSINPSFNTSSEIVQSDYFTTNIIDVKHQYIKNYSKLDSFVIFMCVEGTAVVGVDGNIENISTGETILIPANAELVTFNTESAKILEVYID